MIEKILALFVNLLLTSTMSEAKEINYLQSRLEQARIPIEAIKTTCLHRHVDGFSNEVTESQQDADFFTYNTSNGNIDILYKDLDGSALKVHVTGNKWPIEFIRECLSPANRKWQLETYDKKIKYSQKQGTTVEIYNTQAIVDTYNAGLKIKTLYLIEGEFKAFKAWWHSLQYDDTTKNITEFGLPIMAIPGIESYKNSTKDGLHETILKYINKCRPDNIVLLIDADLYQIGDFDPEKDERKDLSKRLENFYRAVVNFRELAKATSVPDIYMAHIKEEFMEEKPEPLKGLDDLMAAREGRENVILKEIDQLNVESSNLSYFNTHNISKMQPNKIRELFLLSLTRGCPTKFYGKYNQILQNHTFTFKNGQYAYNFELGVVELKAHGDSFEYARIGPKYVKIIQFPTAKGTHIQKIIPWSTGEIKRDYVDKGIKNFFDTIPKYNAFANIPEHDKKKYKQRISDCYNLYYPLTHEPTEGKWPTIEAFLTHVFREQYDVAIDWLYLTFVKPMQKVPAICLVSKEKNTGKSTFINLLHEIFEQNVAIIGNQELTDRFNEDYITKLIIGIEEGLVEKSLIIEKIKAWITNPTATMDIKNLNRQQVDLFAHFVWTSNSPDNFIRIDEDESRFWVRYVSKYEGEENVNMLDSMKEEIPAFLFYLGKNHTLKYPRTGRLHFAPSVYHNEFLQRLQAESHSQLYKNIYIWIQDQFFKFNPPDTVEANKQIITLYYNLKEVIDGVYGVNGMAIKEMQYVKKTLTTEFNLKEPQATSKVSKPIEDVDHTDENPKYINSKKINTGRWWRFDIERFISIEGLASLKIDAKELSQQRALEGTTIEPAEDLPF